MVYDLATDVAVSPGRFGAWTLAGEGVDRGFSHRDRWARVAREIWAVALGQSVRGLILPLIGAALVCAVIGRHIRPEDAVAMGTLSVASVVASVAGFAVSAILGPPLFDAMPDPAQAVRIMILCGIASQAASAWSSRHDVNWRALGPLLSGGTLGLPLGIWLLMHIDRAAYSVTLAVLLLAYGMWRLSRPGFTVRRHVALDVAVGFIGGISGGATGFPGTPLTIWYGCTGGDAARQRALLQPFVLLMQVAAVLAITLANLGDAQGAAFEASFLPGILAALLGTAIGLTWFRGLSSVRFSPAVNGMLIVSGLSYAL